LINPEENRGWSQESYRNYMKRRDAEEQMIKEERLPKPSDKQIGGNHYKDCAIQPVDYIVKNNLDFLEGNVVKYITRHKTKNGIEDIRKVIHYAELILEKKYGKEK
jgi:hypothetical protein